MNRLSRVTFLRPKKKKRKKKRKFFLFIQDTARCRSRDDERINGRCSTVPQRLLKLMNQCQPRTGRKRTPWRRSGDRSWPISLRPSALCARRWRFRSPATPVFRRRWSLNDGDGLSFLHGRRHGHLPGQCWQQSLPPWRVMAAETLVAMVMDFLHEQNCSTLLPSAGSPCTARRTCCLPHGRGPTGPARFIFLAAALRDSLPRGTITILACGSSSFRLARQFYHDN